jgi:dihydropyrimidine dehydrogenase (NAD+) subunit PreA
MYVESFDLEKCMGCGRCVETCGGGCYTLRETPRGSRAFVVNAGNCMGDCHCHRVCPVEGGAMRCLPVEMA